MRTRTLCQMVWLAYLALSGLGNSAMAAPQGENLWAGADARIEKHRKGKATVEILSAGKPVAAAEIRVEQVCHDFLFGCNIFGWGDERMEDDLQTAYRKQFADLFNFATLPFYWASYEEAEGRPRHEYTEKVARWCKERGIRTKGHPLAWNFAEPPWLPNDSQAVFRLQLARIDDCVKRFAGLIDCWDVVNEVVQFDCPRFQQQAPKLTSAWLRVGQLEFTRQCFLHARQANPEAVLLINDFRTDPPYEKVIEGLKTSQGRKLYDAIGIQSHQHGGVWPNEKIWEVCNRFSRFGVPLHFTEVTILSGDEGRRKPGGPWPSTPEGEIRQAEEVVRFYTMLFSHPAVEAITWWDLSDLHAWQDAPAGLLRRDMSPKPAYAELLKLVKGKWWTHTELKTGKDGRAQFRGFFGDYKLYVMVEGKSVEKMFTLRKTANNHWLVEW